MNTKYISRMLEEVLFDDKYNYIEFHTSDYRSNFEIEITEASLFMSFCQDVSKRGWVGKIAQIPQRLLVGVEFDIKGDDFNSFIVTISMKTIHDTISHLKGGYPEIISEMNSFVAAGGEDFLKHIPTRFKD